MNKKGTKALASATLMSLVLTTALATGNVKAAANGQATRVGGTDRYETAAKVATTNFTTSDNVVLVSGEGYADSVSASVLAKKLNAPIVLTGSKTLDANAKSAIETLKAKNVYIIGGTGSISASIETGLKSDYTVTRLGGQDRYATNLAIANKLVDLGVSKSNIIAVAGTGFADALSVAPVAAADNEILLLTKNDTDAMKATADFAKDSNVTVVGTTNVVNGDIYNQLNADKRIDGGADRFATNINVLKAFDSDLKADKLYVANATQANPDNLYADALVASAIAGKYSAPLVLVDKDGSTGTNNAVSYIGTKATKDTDLQVVGGTGVVSDATVTAIENVIKDKDIDPEVSSITANGLNQIKVVFNQEVDSDTAEDVTNYKVDGSSLTDGTASATLQDDNKTVLITLAAPRKQYDNVDVTVKKGILTADKSKNVPEFTQNVTFSDTAVPTLSSVTAQGNNKLTVKFSEPINLGTVSASDINDDGDAKISGNSNLLSKFKIDGQNISNFGLDSTYTLAKNAVIDSNNKGWASEIQFYFNSSLTSGNKTLKISDGDQNGSLSDAAGFTFQETSQDFNVDSLTTKPQITSVTGDDSGKVYINFDRAMDTSTAQLASNYTVNDSAAGVVVSKAELKQDDTQVKLTVKGLNKGSNKVYISNNVKDAYGNKVADDTYKSFDLSEDTTKPAVSSISLLDDSTIRVRFSKDVLATYAVNKANYKLQDNSGTNINDKILATGTNSEYQNSYPITIPGKTAAPTDDDSTDVVDIHVPSKLTDANYTLTVKNIMDTASTPNVMDDYTQTFEGSNTVTPEVEGNATALTDTTDSTNPFRKVVITFNKTMDASSLTNTSNYKFKNASGDTKTLPSGTTIDTSADNKSAIIIFPSAYGTNNNPITISDYNDGNAIAAKSGDNLVTDIAVIGVKDTNGNGLDVSQLVHVDNSNLGNVTAGSTAIEPNSVKYYYDGDNLKVNVKFTKAIDNLNYADFLVNGVQPNSGYKNSDGTVTFVFNDGSKIDTTTDADAVIAGFTATDTKITAVKAGGAKQSIIYTVPTGIKTTDVDGYTIPVVTAANGITPYYYQVAPKTVAANWAAGKYAADDANYANDGYIDIAFDTPLDVNSGVGVNDFVFSTLDGTPLKPTNVVVSGKNVRFIFDQNDSVFTTGTKIKIFAKSTQAIRTQEDKNEQYATYAPSSDDLGVRILTFGTTGATK
ncbi:cell wall-binding repeat-containing protein [Clostridium tyrobutyricum]|uniref:cell wall-binding repeat-containing protein n=1 Tax=Clostridium tyrobutyricum TaxID=1519 RepID=UPI00073D36D1|nr:cell wall-binding repeat-containing protein [Clostridium tyrobutyricum]